MSGQENVDATQNGGESPGARWGAAVPTEDERQAKEAMRIAQKRSGASESPARQPAVRLGALPLGMLGVAIALVLLWRVAVMAGLSGDVFWQWTAGQWMLAHHRLMTRDVFSYTVFGRHWVTEEWGYEVLLAALRAWWGPLAFWMMSAGVASLAVIVAVARMRRQGNSWTWVGLMAVVVGVSVALFMRDRPQTVSYLFFALELWLLDRARQRPRTLYVLPPMLLVWANLHGSFLLALLVLLLEGVWALVPLHWGRLAVSRPLPRRDIWLTVAASFAAAMLNPHGPGLFAYAYHVSSNPEIANNIGEWLSPNFHQLDEMLVVAGPILLTVLAISVRTGTVEWSDMVLAGGLLVATLQSARFMPYFDIAWVGFYGWLDKPLDLNRTRPTRLTPVVAAGLAIWLLHGPTVPAGTPYHEPVAAANFLRHQPGRVFTRYRWGDYMIHRHILVFIDGRTDLYVGTGVFSTYLKLKSLSINPDVVFQRYHIDWVVWPTGWALSTFLEHDPAWRLVMDRGGALVFARVAGHPLVGAPS